MEFKLTIIREQLLDANTERLPSLKDSAGASVTVLQGFDAEDLARTMHALDPLIAMLTLAGYDFNAADDIMAYGHHGGVGNFKLEFDLTNYEIRGEALPTAFLTTFSTDFATLSVPHPPQGHGPELILVIRLSTRSGIPKAVDLGGDPFHHEPSLNWYLGFQVQGDQLVISSEDQTFDGRLEIGFAWIAQQLGDALATAWHDAAGEHHQLGLLGIFDPFNWKLEGDPSTAHEGMVMGVGEPIFKHLAEPSNTSAVLQDMCSPRQIEVRDHGPGHAVLPNRASAKQLLSDALATEGLTRRTSGAIQRFCSEGNTAPQGQPLHMGRFKGLTYAELLMFAHEKGAIDILQELDHEDDETTKSEGLRILGFTPDPLVPIASRTTADWELLAEFIRVHAPLDDEPAFDHMTAPAAQAATDLASEFGTFSQSLKLKALEGFIDGMRLRPPSLTAIPANANVPLDRSTWGQSTTTGKAFEDHAARLDAALQTYLVKNSSSPQDRADAFDAHAVVAQLLAKHATAAHYDDLTQGTRGKLAYAIVRLLTWLAPEPKASHRSAALAASECWQLAIPLDSNGNPAESAFDHFLTWSTYLALSDLCLIGMDAAGDSESLGNTMEDLYWRVRYNALAGPQAKPRFFDLQIVDEDAALDFRNWFAEDFHDRLKDAGNATAGNDYYNLISAIGLFYDKNAMQDDSGFPYMTVNLAQVRASFDLQQALKKRAELEQSIALTGLEGQSISDTLDEYPNLLGSQSRTDAVAEMYEVCTSPHWRAMLAVHPRRDAIATWHIDRLGLLDPALAREMQKSVLSELGILHALRAARSGLEPGTDGTDDLAIGLEALLSELGLPGTPAQVETEARELAEVIRSYGHVLPSVMQVDDVEQSTSPLNGPADTLKWIIDTMNAMPIGENEERFSDTDFDFDEDSPRLIRVVTATMTTSLLGTKVVVERSSMTKTDKYDAMISFVKEMQSALTLIENMAASEKKIRPLLVSGVWLLGLTAPKAITAHLQFANAGLKLWGISDGLKWSNWFKDLLEEEARKKSPPAFKRMIAAGKWLCNVTHIYTISVSAEALSDALEEEQID
ncbi:MAG: hypothetical protein AAGA48_36205, partial [Myxococcota bacterium]